MRDNYSKLIKPELEYIIDNANFTEEELNIFIALSKGQSRVYIMGTFNLAATTLNNRIVAIREKVSKVRRLIND